MNIQRYILFLLPLLAVLLRANAQQATSAERQQLKQWLDASFEYRYNNLDSSFYYGFKVLEAAKASNHRDVEADALRSLSTTYQARGDYEEALDYGFQALNLSRELDDQLKTAHALNVIGMIYDQQGNFPGALNYYQEAYDGYKAVGDEEWLAMIAVNLGILFKGQEVYEKVIPYYREAYAIYQKLNLPVESAFAETNLGSVFYFTQQYDSCVYYSLKAEKALAEHNYLQIQPTAQGNAGLGYFGLGRFKEAKEYLEKALAGHRKYANKKEIAFVLIHLSNVYKELGQSDKSYEALREAKQLAEAIGSSKEVMDAAKYLAEYYRSRHNYPRALEEYINYSMVKDTLFEREKMQAITNYQFQYETEKKEQQIERLSQQAAIQQLKLRQRGLLLVVTIVLLSSIALLVYFLQNRRKIRAEARLQHQAAQEVLQAEERERRRIATDLHDGVGQMLSAALLNLNEAREKAPENSIARESVDRALALLGESYDEMRAISHQMMPNALLKAGLASSIREFVEKLDGPKLKVSLDVVGLDQRLDEQTETVLYRVIQEAVNNVVKHAEASKLMIQLNKDEDGIAVTIEDDGRGFDRAKLLQFEGIGLKNIASRIAFLNGMVDVDSAPGKGTLLAIHIPAS